jgi:hypothetical protein
MPVWHVSVSVWRADGTRRRDDPKAAEREAVRLLRGVGDDVEWWIWNPATLIRHLRVALTSDEYARVPPGCAIADAGESGPPRPRTAEAGRTGWSISLAGVGR